MEMEKGIFKKCVNYSVALGLCQIQSFLTEDTENTESFV